jgi:hypothetical protein
MSPNWTGRSARTLSECRFTDDADPFQRFASRRENTASVVLAIVIGVLLSLALVHGLVS